MDVMSRTTLATVRHENGVHILGQMVQIGNALLTKTTILFEYVSMSANGVQCAAIDQRGAYEFRMGKKVNNNSWFYLLPAALMLCTIGFPPLCSAPNHPFVRVDG